MLQYYYGRLWEVAESKGHTNMLITRDNTVEWETHRYTADASDLRLPVGCFPQSLKTTLGNKRNFYLTRIEVFGDYDEVVWVDY